MNEFIYGRNAVFVRPLDPREGNEWECIGEATNVEVVRGPAKASCLRCSECGHDLDDNDYCPECNK